MNMNILNQPIRHSLRLSQRARLNIARYSTATPFVPPASLRDTSDSSWRTNNGPNSRFEPKPKPRPTSPTFYTARAAYYDQVLALESAIQYASHSLRALHLLPLPAFARASLPPPEFNWKNKTDMEGYMQCTLTMSRYRRILQILNQLNEYRRIADTAGCTELGEAMAGILDIFRKGQEGSSTAKKKVVFDQYGRTYTTGRRKTSTARVWIIPAKVKTPDPAPASDTPIPEPSIDAKPDAEIVSLSKEKSDIDKDFDLTEDIAEIDFPAPSPIAKHESLDELFGLPSPSSPIPVQPSKILINNFPLSTYFKLPVDREKVVRPLKVAGVLGGYNIFALVRGGGTTGQSGAVSLAIAKGLAAHEPHMADILRKGKFYFSFHYNHGEQQTNPLTLSQRNSSDAIRVWSSEKRQALPRLANGYVRFSYALVTY